MYAVQYRTHAMLGKFGEKKTFLQCYTCFEEAYIFGVNPCLPFLVFRALPQTVGGCMGTPMYDPWYATW